MDDNDVMHLDLIPNDPDEEIEAAPEVWMDTSYDSEAPEASAPSADVPGK
jgi:hypothetical protein